MMSETEIKNNIEKLEREKADYDQMDEEGKFNCDHYEAYDLIRGQLEAYNDILGAEKPQKFSTRFKKFLKEWCMSRATSFLMGLCSGFLLSTFVFIIVVVMDHMGMIA